MSKKLNLLPVVLLLVLLGIGGYLLLKEDINFKKDTTIEVRRLESFPNKVYTSTQFEKQRRIIRNQEELQTFLNEIDPSNTLVFNQTIDFDKEIVIAVTPSTQNTEASSIRIKRMEIDDKDLSYRVVVINSEPLDNCLLEENPTLPVDIIAVEKSNLKEEYEIEFNAVKEELECETELIQEENTPSAL